ncbi:MAG: cupin domain-containing protein [Actinomycetota bacterium]
MPILYARQAPEFELSASARITGLAAPSRGSAEVTTYRVRLDPGSAVTAHRHDHEEVFTLVAGSAMVVLDDEEYLLGPGDTVIVPPGTEHYAYSQTDHADFFAAVPVGTSFVVPDGDDRLLPDWGR